MIEERRPALPRRDLWLLPLTSLLTVVGLLIAAEGVSRVFYTEQLGDSCKVADPTQGSRVLPDCTSALKAAEGPWTTNHYNALGYRTDPAWSPYPANAPRIGLIGTSAAQGYLIKYEETAGATLAADLSAACHEPVEVPNLGAIGFAEGSLTARLVEALAMHPKLVVFMVVPHDLQSMDVTAVPAPGAAPAAGLGAASAEPGEPGAAGGAADSHEGVLHLASRLVKNARIVEVMQHFLFRNPDLYLPLYLRFGDQADFLRVPLSHAWQARLMAFDGMLGRFEALGRAAGVPIALVYAPQEAQSGLLSRRTLPAGVDPLAFGVDLGQLAARHGMLYHDVTQDFRAVPDTQDLYYPVDGHISGAGQIIMGRAIAREILADLPAFSGCKTRTTAARDP